MPTRAQMEELDAIIALLKEHPERHRQDAYVRFEGETPPALTPELDCGSAFCIAGAAVARAGIQVGWYQMAGVNDGVWYAGETTLEDEHTGWQRTISSVASELLGLTWDEAAKLFAGDNTMADIERIRASLTVTARTWPEVRAQAQAQRTEPLFVDVDPVDGQSQHGR